MIISHTMIITIDWYTGTWKWTTALGVATILWYTYLDTGAMYRCVALYARQHNLLKENEERKAKIIDEITIEFRTIEGLQTTFMNGENIEKEIRSSDLWLVMRPIVSCLPLRKKMISLQQSFWDQWNIVCDWRDAGTHIFPDAELKIFMTCDIQTRVQRRMKQLRLQWLPVDEKKISQETLMRDQTDYLWPDAVNKKAIDAKELDTSNSTIQQQIDIVVKWAREMSVNSSKIH